MFPGQAYNRLIFLLQGGRTPNVRCLLSLHIASAHLFTCPNPEGERTRLLILDNYSLAKRTTFH